MYNVLKTIYQIICEKIFINKIKDNYYYFLSKNKIPFKKLDRNIFIITMPEYGNIGDHFIGQSQMEYLKNRFKDYKIYGITDHEYIKYIGWIRRNIKETDLICFIGGGNFGYIYLTSEYYRRYTISNCRNCKLVLFPQSSIWRTNGKDKYQLLITKKIYSKHKHLYLIAREKNTYKFMINNFINNKVYLAPDIVLTKNINTKKIFDSKKRILLCFRDDIEKSLNEDILEKIQEYFIDKNYDIVRFDTETHEKISSELSNDYIKKTIDIFLSADCIITDRLHGMIISNIVGRPCLAFDNATKKISGVYDLWIDKNNTIFYNEKISIYNQLDELIMKKFFKYNNILNLNKFDNVISEIMNEGEI